MNSIRCGFKNGSPWLNSKRYQVRSPICSMTVLNKFKLKELCSRSTLPIPVRHCGQCRLQHTVGSTVKIKGTPQTKLILLRIDKPKAVKALKQLKTLFTEAALITRPQTISSFPNYRFLNYPIHARSSQSKFSTDASHHRAGLHPVIFSAH